MPHAPESPSSDSAPRPVPPSPSYDAYAPSNDGVDLFLPLSIVISALIVAGSVVYGAKALTNTVLKAPTVAQGPPTQNAPDAPAAPAAPEAKVDVALGANPILGNKDAKVTIVEFSDLQCPFCKRYHDQTWPEIKKSYVDTGKVRYAFRHFPLNNIHPQAAKAGEAIACAREQGKFYELTDKIFANQQTMMSDDIKRYVAELGLDSGTFNECFDSGRMKGEVDKDLSDGTAAGISGTPTFFVNGKRLVGAQPFEAFKAAIDEELAG